MSLDEFSYALDAVLAGGTVEELLHASPARGLLAPASRVPWLGGEALQRHLPPDEAILWVGRPEANLNLTCRGVLTVLPLIAFVVFWEASAASSGAPVFFLFWGVFVVLFGGYRAMGRFFLRARRTIYAVTTRRIVRMVQRSSGGQLDTKLLRTIPRISVTTGKEGRGTIAFGDELGSLSRSWAIRTSGRLSDTDAISFVNISEAAAVARLIGSLQTHETG
ncbi:MAG: hypothetical protein ACLP0J_29660 [Solirubrobacteraceae bacterium]